MTRPTVSTCPIGPNQIEVRTACRHGAYRTGYQLGETVTERIALCSSLFHHHVIEGCSCMWALWPRYRVATVPADLNVMRDRFNTLWASVEAQHRQRGFALIDWPAAVQTLTGEVA